MTDSYTGEVNAPDWTLVSTISGITFTVGNKYNVTVVKQCQFKVANYIVPVFNTNFDFIAGTDDLYIKTGGTTCTLSLLDCGSAG